MRILGAILLLLAGCAGPAVLPSSTVPEIPQGIKGRVIKLVGDFTMDPPSGTRVPLIVPVHVFKGKLQPLAKPDPRHATFLTVIRPGPDGSFELPLPPGLYTLVAEINGQLYLNNWTDDGCWAPVTVRPGAWTNYTIEDVLEATF